MTYAFCERELASPTSPWHIRQLTEKGRMLGGGADTLALCGIEVAWDLEIELTGYNRALHHPGHCCQRCVKQYEAHRERGEETT